jgi:hypothetical protein
MENIEIIESEPKNQQNNAHNTIKDKGDSEEQQLLKENDSPKKDSNIIPNYSVNKKESSDADLNCEKEFINIDRKGNMLMFLFNKKGEPLIVIGPNWQLAFIMFIIVNIISFCYFFFLWNFLFVFLRIIGIIIYLIQTGSYLTTILMNPGIPSKELYLENYNNLDEIGSYRICNVCKIIMRNKDKTDHCDECNICIIGADHHCPWTSKCVGKNNKNMFYIFVFSIFALLIYFFCGAMSCIIIDNNPKHQ